MKKTATPSGKELKKTPGEFKKRPKAKFWEKHPDRITDEMKRDALFGLLVM